MSLLRIVLCHAQVRSPFGPCRFLDRSFPVLSKDAMIMASIFVLGPCQVQ